MMHSCIASIYSITHTTVTDTHARCQWKAQLVNSKRTRFFVSQLFSEDFWQQGVQNATGRSGDVMMVGAHSFNAISLRSSGDWATVSPDSLETAGETVIPLGFPQQQSKGTSHTHTHAHTHILLYPLTAAPMCTVLLDLVFWETTHLYLQWLDFTLILKPVKYCEFCNISTKLQYNVCA